MPYQSNPIRKNQEIQNLTLKSPQNILKLTTPQQNEYATGSLAISSLSSSRSVIHSVLQKYRKDAGDIVHIRHVTPEGAPLFTQGSGLDEEFEELREGMGEGEKVRDVVRLGVLKGERVVC